MQKLFDRLLNKSKSPTTRQQIGRKGEKLAEKFLSKKGLKTLCRNFNCKTGEIDLVMTDSDSIVFVEVKTRANEDIAEAESSITPAKKKRMARAARYFLTINNIEDRPTRFDVVIVLQTTDKPQIRYYENAFTP